MPVDISSELSFITSRSGGKGGQHVNKVETAVMARFPVSASAILTESQKETVLKVLQTRITAGGILTVRSQTERTQAANKAQAIRRINELVNKALVIRRSRVRGKPTRASVEKRLQFKKQLSEKKQHRRNDLH
jgi:ribosome-associated protein